MLRCARTSPNAVAASYPIAGRTHHEDYESTPFVKDKELSKDVCHFAIIVSLSMPHIPE